MPSSITTIGAEAPEVYLATREECAILSEIVFGYLACTLGPNCSRVLHLWTPEYRQQLAGILQRSHLHPHVAAAAMHFVGRLKRRQPSLELSGKAGINMFVAAMMVANKCIHDRWLSGKSWAHDILGHTLSRRQLVKLQSEFLKAIEWDVSLSQKVFDDFDEIACGWMKMRETAPSPDFFASRKWDGLRAPAHNLLDGIPVEVSQSEMYELPIGADAEFQLYIVGTLPVVYPLTDKFWEKVPLDSFPSPPFLNETLSSTSSSSPTPRSQERGLLPSPPWLEEAYAPTISSHPGCMSRSKSFDNLTAVDWKQEFTPSERKLLGLNRPRFLLTFAVDTLSLPSMYEKGENPRMRIHNWLSEIECEEYPVEVQSS